MKAKEAKVTADRVYDAAVQERIKKEMTREECADEVEPVYICTVLPASEPWCQSTEVLPPAVRCADLRSFSGWPGWPS